MKQLVAAAAVVALAATGAALLWAAPMRRPPAPAGAKGPASVGAKSPAVAAAEAVLARLKADEDAVKSTRYTLATTVREGNLPKGTRASDTLEPARSAPVVARERETVILSGGDWHREVTMMDAQSAPTGHLVLGMRDKEGRTLQESGHGSAPQREGAIGMVPPQGPAEALLLRRSDLLLNGILWTSVKPAAAQTTLTGNAADGGQVTVVVRTSPRYAVERLMLSQPNTTPQGAVTQTQDLRATYAVENNTLALKQLDYLQSVTGVMNQARLTTYAVEGARYNVPVHPDELQISLPAGTRVTDRRVDPPVQYTAGEKELTLAEARALSEKAAANTAVLTKAAPEIELKTLDGKTAKLSENRGKVVLLTWFASWCGPCNAEAPIMEKNVWQKYRDRGLAVYGVNASEPETPEKKAREFVSQHGVTYPVMLDTDDSSTRAYQIKAFPTIALVDKKGILRYIQAGFDEHTVTQKVEELLAEK